ncbi:hypothetical protein GE09DRAFT_1290121 [Coniochaeta sp. 2T2.1]|nr:hypothetical protein GE09DRAFT_1290121 [Coniochaeta sp. 2T2.1]
MFFSSSLPPPLPSVVTHAEPPPPSSNPTSSASPPQVRKPRPLPRGGQHPPHKRRFSRQRAGSTPPAPQVTTAHVSAATAFFVVARQGRTNPDAETVDRLVGFRPFGAAMAVMSYWEKAVDGFYGLDLYSWGSSMHAVVEYIDRRVLEPHGRDAKAIVRAHNSHGGDARATDMAWTRDELNTGPLCKEAYGERALAIGCGTYTGRVPGAHDWDDDMSIDLREGRCNRELREAFMKQRLERYIGVIYRPRTDRMSHYSPVVLPGQFDGFVWFDGTNPGQMRDVHQPHTYPAVDETWPV